MSSVEFIEKNTRPPIIDTEFISMYIYIYIYICVCIIFPHEVDETDRTPVPPLHRTDNLANGAEKTLTKPVIWGVDKVVCRNKRHCSVL